MARFYFRQFYTTTVEHYLQAVVRKYKNSIPQEWNEFTTNWIEKLSDEDKDFIRFVFHADYCNSYAGVSCYPGNDFLLKHRRLYELERQYAVDAGFLNDSSDTSEEV